MISRVQSEFTDAVIKRIAATVAAWRGEADAGEYQDTLVLRTTPFKVFE